jgi:hypothetical protein
MFIYKRVDDYYIAARPMGKVEVGVRLRERLDEVVTLYRDGRGVSSRHTPAIGLSKSLSSIVKMSSRCYFSTTTFLDEISYQSHGDTVI